MAASPSLPASSPQAAEGQTGERSESLAVPCLPFPLPAAQLCPGLRGLYCFFLICPDGRHAQLPGPLCGASSSREAPQGRGRPFLPLPRARSTLARPPTPAGPGCLPSHPTRPVNLTGRARLAWWGRGLLLKGAVRGCPGPLGFSDLLQGEKRQQAEEPPLPELSVECGEEAWCPGMPQTSWA